MSTRQRLIWASLGTVGLVVLIVIVFNVVHRSSPRSRRTFEVEMRASAGTSAQLFWADDLHFVEERSIRVPLQPTSEGFQRLRFPLPRVGVRWLRFDPTDAPGEVLIGRVRLLDSQDHVLETFDPQSFRPANQIASITQQDAGTKVTTTPAAKDPFLVWSLGHQDRRSLRDRLSLVTPTSLLLVSLIAILLVATCVVVIGVTAFGTGRSAAPSYVRRASWLSATRRAASPANLQSRTRPTHRGRAVYPGRPRRSWARRPFPCVS